MFEQNDGDFAALLGSFLILLVLLLWLVSINKRKGFWNFVIFGFYGSYLFYGLEYKSDYGAGLAWLGSLLLVMWLHSLLVVFFIVKSFILKKKCITKKELANVEFETRIKYDLKFKKQFNAKLLETRINTLKELIDKGHENIDLFEQEKFIKESLRNEVVIQNSIKCPACNADNHDKVIICHECGLVLNNNLE